MPIPGMFRQRVFALLVLSGFFFPLLGATKVLIVYHSETGHTETMARCVSAGCHEAGASHGEVHHKTVSEATFEDVLNSDAVILGSPVWNGNPHPAMLEFLSRWKFSPGSNTTIGASFVTAGGISAGEEFAQVAMLRAMMIYDLIVVGSGDWLGAFGASAVTKEAPFDSWSAHGHIADQFCVEGRELGARVYRLADLIARVPEL